MIPKLHSATVTKRLLEAMAIIIANRPDIKRKYRFANELGIDYRHLVKYQQGTHHPTVDILVTACITFNISPNWLLLGKGPMFSTTLSPSTHTPQPPASYL